MIESELHGEMTEKSEHPAYPAHYPLGGTFADFLCWHMDYWGTRPTGNTIRNAVPWTPDGFLQAAFGSAWENETYRVSLGYWRGARSAPREDSAIVIINEFFGNNPVFSQWRDDFEKAYRDSKGRGKNPRTKVFPDPPPIKTQTASIPRLTPYFMGRDDKRDELVDAILTEGDVSPAILVQGGPGMGKTELTKAIAHHAKIVEHFGERRWFVRLETATTAEAMKDAIIRELGCDPQQGFQAALNYLATARSLIVLDNLETPWEHPDERRSTEAALTELAANADVTVLASFRGMEKVGGPRWQDHPLAELPYLDAVNLFASISGQWVQNDPDLSNFVEALGGIPLAIELVARRAHGRTSLTSLWREWLRIGADLAIHPDFEADRLTSLPHSIELSLQSSRITPPAMRLFRLLGCLPAGLSVEDRDSLIGDDSFSAEERLLGVGLAIEPRGRTDLLPPIRDHALRHYKPEADDANQWVDYFFGMTRYLGEAIGTTNGEGVLPRLQTEFGNIEACLREKIRRNQRYEAIAALHGFMKLVLSGSMTTNIIQELADASRIDNDELDEAHCVTMQADIAFGRSDHEVATTYYSRALAIYSQRNYALGEANCLKGLGKLAFRRSDYDVAQAAYEEALPKFRQLNEVQGEANCLRALGDVALWRSDYDAARTAYENAKLLYRQNEHLVGEANCIKALGNIALEYADFETARIAFHDALGIYRRIQEALGEANCLTSLGRIALHHSEYEDARAYFEEALLLYSEMDGVLGEANCIKDLGHIWLHTGKHDAAREAYDKAILLYVQVGDVLGEANCIVAQGDLAIRQSDYLVARMAYKNAARLYRSIGDASGEQICATKLEEL
jgi:tetratricopeptide (TPR) repeat protein